MNRIGLKWFSFLVVLWFPLSSWAEVEPNNIVTEANSLAIAADSKATNISFGSITGTLSTTDGNDYFAFIGQAGQRVLITTEVVSGNLNTKLSLRDASDVQLNSDVNSGPGNASQIENILLSATGTFYINVSRHAGEGDYNLRLFVISDGQAETDTHPDDSGNSGNNNALSKAELIAPFGTETSGQMVGEPTLGISTAGDSDWYRLYGFAGESISVSVEALDGTGFQPTVSLYQADGTLLTEDSNSGATSSASISAYTLSANEILYLRVSGSGQGFQAAYGLELSSQNRSYQTELRQSSTAAEATPIAVTTDAAIGTFRLGQAT